METLRIDIQNEQEKKVLMAFLDSLSYQYTTDNGNYSLTDQQLMNMIERKASFLEGKTSSRTWSEIKKKYEGV